MPFGYFSNPEKARLRLAAGCALLKIAREKVYYDMIKLDNFQQLAYLIVVRKLTPHTCNSTTSLFSSFQDDCSQVREQFASKLYKGLIGVKLPLEFLSIYSLVPLLKLRNPSDRRILDYTRAVRNYVVNNVNRRRDLLKKNTAVQAKPHDFMPDYCLTYAVWLLSHHSMLKNHTNISALRQLKE